MSWATARCTDRSLAGPPRVDRVLGAVEHVLRQLGELPSSRSSRRALRACVCQRSDRGRPPIPSHSHISSSRSNNVQYVEHASWRIDADAVGELDHVEGRVQQPPHRRSGSQLVGHALPDPRAVIAATSCAQRPPAGSRTARRRAPARDSRKRLTSTPMSTGGRRCRRNHNEQRSAARRQSRYSSS